MMFTPAMIGQVADWIALAISAAPKIANAVQDAIKFVGALFGAGLIDKATQDALMAHIDDLALAWLKGETPPAWTVEPDPPSPAP